MFKAYHFILIGLTLFLSACGGGSGGGGSSSSGGGNTGGGTPAVQTGTITVNQSSLSFEAGEFGALPPPQTLVLTFDAPQVVVGSLPGTSFPNWIDPFLTQTSNTRGTISVNITRTSLSPGVYETTIRAVSSNESGSQIIDIVDIPVSYTITEAQRVELDIEQIDVSFAPIDEPITRTVTLMGEGIRWEVRGSNQGITLSEHSGTIPASGQQVDITITPDPFTTVQTRTAEITFSNMDNLVRGTILPVVINYEDGILTDPREIAFAAQSGSTALQSQSLDIDSFDITLEDQINWVSSTDQPWLTVSPVNGVIQTNLTPDVISELTVNVNPTGLSAGIHNGFVSFTNDVSDQVYQLPVSFVISQNNLITSRKGVALSSLATLSQSIDVTDTAGTDVPWTAASNASWLTVTPSGAAGEPLVLTADPTGLANNSLSEAVVSVTSTLTELTNTETINVGLWNSTDTPIDTSVTIGMDVDTRGNVFVADPIRPYIYVLAGGDRTNGPNFSSTLSVYNIYTGLQVGNSITPQLLGSSELIISDDGQELYIYPISGNSSAQNQYERYELPNFGTSTLFDIPFEATTRGADFTRINGISYIITGGGSVIEAATGNVLSSLSIFAGNAISTSQNGVACLNNSPTGFGARQLDCFDLLGSGLAGTDIAANQRNDVIIASNVNDFITSENGENVLLISSALQALNTVNGQTVFELDDTLAFATAADGTIVTSALNTPENPLELRSYTADGTLIGTTLTDNFDFADNLVVSNDGGRVTIITLLLADGRTAILDFMDTP